MTRLEGLANEHGGGIQTKAATAATALRHLLGWNARAGKTNLTMGWSLGPIEVKEYAQTRRDALGALAEIEADAADQP